MPLRWSFSTNAFVDLPLPDALAAVRATGFEGAELLADRPHAWPPELPAEEMARLASRMRALDLTAANVNANTASGFYPEPPPEPVFEPSLASPRAVDRRRRVEFTLAAIDLASTVGAPSVSITTGRALPGAPPERALRLLRESLAPILQRARERGVRIGIEYEPGLLVENAAELMALLEEVDDPALGANLDFAHAVVNGENPSEVARTLGDRLVHVHLADVAGRKHFHLPPGGGNADLDGFCAALEGSGYGGWVTFELYTCRDDPEGAARAARSWAREFQGRASGAINALRARAAPPRGARAGPS